MGREKLEYIIKNMESDLTYLFRKDAKMREDIIGLKIIIRGNGDFNLKINSEVFRSSELIIINHLKKIIRSVVEDDTTEVTISFEYDERTKLSISYKI